MPDLHTDDNYLEEIVSICKDLIIDWLEKTVIALADIETIIYRLKKLYKKYYLDTENIRITTGTLFFNDKDTVELAGSLYRYLRGNDKKYHCFLYLDNIKTEQIRIECKEDEILSQIELLNRLNNILLGHLTVDFMSEIIKYMINVLNIKIMNDGSERRNNTITVYDSSYGDKNVEITKLVVNDIVLLNRLLYTGVIITMEEEVKKEVIKGAGKLSFFKKPIFIENVILEVEKIEILRVTFRSV